MSLRWLPAAVIGAASWLVPREARGEWLRGWRSELWYVPPRQAIRFSFGSFADAQWLRRNPSRARRPLLDSPLACLGFLALAAAIGCAIAAALPLPGPSGFPARFHARDLAEGCGAMAPFTLVLLPAMLLAMGRAPGPDQARPGRLRRAVFLVLKILLVQPGMLAAFAVVIRIGDTIPMAPQVGMFGIWMLTFRWVILDQRRRCPECLRLLTCPVRIGSASDTFLEWYGAESVCARGHGLLQVPELAATYSRGQQWLPLDDSWSSVFAGIRQH